MARTIDGESFRNMMLAAAAAVDARKEEINELNVFPVPDGDTGTNMSMTLSSAAAELSKLQKPTLPKALEVTASAVLRGARGNSGVILSLLYRGITRSLRPHSSVGGLELAAALGEGVSTAYQAVMKPAEGTILTVSRISAEEAEKAAQAGADAEETLRAAIEGAKRALPETTEQNPVLKKAGVIDAGGYGYLVMLEAMYSALTGKETPKFSMPEGKVDSSALMAADFSEFDGGEITFTYCTEFIVRRDTDRAPEKLRALLESIGDCAVVVEGDDLIKIHVHTDTPDRALAEGLRYGELLTVKIENMREQLGALSAAGTAPAPQKESAEPEKRYGFVAVAVGEGMCSVFEDLGVDRIVEGGQTMNPSTEDILHAIEMTPSEIVFFLPNNKNIVMAGQQAAELSSRQVIVLQSKTVPQGISALLSFDPEADVEQNKTAMTEALQSVKTGMITCAVRDREFDGRLIRQGEYLSIMDDKQFVNGREFDDVVRKLARTMCSRDSSFITVFSGEGSTEAETEAVVRAFEAEAKNAEVNVVCGGQPVYSYIVSVE